MIPVGVWVIAVIYFGVVLLMLPFREQAYQDDFAYYQTVRNFLNTGILKISEWSAASLISQVWWGALFSSIFGLSFKTLHLSTVVIFFFGLISFFLTLHELGIPQKRSVIFTLTLLSFPTIIRYVFTFMTDIPYLSLMLISIYFGVLGLKRKSALFLLLASSIAMVGFLTRQLGVLIPISLLAVLVYKSIRERKIQALLLLAIATPALIVFWGYNKWVYEGDNMTMAQRVYVYQDIKYLKMYLLPQGLHKLRPTSDIYDEWLYRTAYYVNLITIPSSLLLFFFKLPKTTVISNLKKNKKSLAIGAAILSLLYWRLFQRVENSDIQRLLIFSPIQALSDLHWGYTSFWVKTWNLITIISFPIWAYVIGRALGSFNSQFFEKRKKKLFLLLAIFTLVVAATCLYYILNGTRSYGEEFLKSSQFIFFWWVTLTILGLHLALYTPKFSTKKESAGFFVSMFLVLAGIAHFAITLAGHYMWEEYFFALLPYFLIAIAILTKKMKTNLTKGAVALLILLTFSVSEAKINYDINGLQWEEANKIMKAENVDPRDVSFAPWAWIPFYFFEESYNKRVIEANGDRSKVNQPHTWWDDPEYKYRKQKLGFPAEDCSGIPPGAKIAKEIQATSIFANIRYCMILREE